MLHIIIFSKDRPFQLRECLRTLLLANADLFRQSVQPARPSPQDDSGGSSRPAVSPSTSTLPLTLPSAAAGAAAGAAAVECEPNAQVQPQGRAQVSVHRQACEARGHAEGVRRRVRIIVLWAASAPAFERGYEALAQAYSPDAVTASIPRDAAASSSAAEGASGQRKQRATAHWHVNDGATCWKAEVCRHDAAEVSQPAASATGNSGARESHAHAAPCQPPESVNAGATYTYTGVDALTTCADLEGVDIEFVKEDDLATQVQHIIAAAQAVENAGIALAGTPSCAPTTLSANMAADDPRAPGRRRVRASFIAFGVDDALWCTRSEESSEALQPGPFATAMATLAEVPQCIAYHCKLHPGVWYHQPTDSIMRVPTFRRLVRRPHACSVAATQPDADARMGEAGALRVLQQSRSQPLLFQLGGEGSHDYNYPGDLCFSVYRADDVHAAVANIQSAYASTAASGTGRTPSPLSHPNEFEVALTRQLSTWRWQPVSHERAVVPLGFGVPAAASRRSPSGKVVQGSSSAVMRDSNAPVEQLWCAMPPRPALVVVTVNRVQQLYANPVCDACSDGGGHDEPRAELNPSALLPLLHAVPAVMLDSDWYSNDAARNWKSVHVGMWRTRPPTLAPDVLPDPRGVHIARPLVSILLPVHNGEPFLQEALQSLLAQTYRPIELVVIDDGSTDGTATILEELRSTCQCKKASAFTVVVSRLHPCQGVAAALNHGLRLCNGDLIARMDADDVSLPTRVATEVTYHVFHPEVDVVGAGVQVLEQAKALPNLAQLQTLPRILVQPCDPKVLTWELWFYCPLAHPTVMAKRRFFFHDGSATPLRREYPTNVAHAEDYALWLREAWAAPSAIFGNIGEPLLLLRKHAANTSDARAETQQRSALLAKASVFLRALSEHRQQLAAAGLVADVTLQAVLSLCAAGADDVRSCSAASDEDHKAGAAERDDRFETIGCAALVQALECATKGSAYLLAEPSRAGAEHGSGVDMLTVATAAADVLEVLEALTILHASATTSTASIGVRTPAVRKLIAADVNSRMGELAMAALQVFGAEAATLWTRWQQRLAAHGLRRGEGVPQVPVDQTPHSSVLVAGDRGAGQSSRLVGGGAGIRSASGSNREAASEEHAASASRSGQRADRSASGTGQVEVAAEATETAALRNAASGAPLPAAPARTPSASAATGRAARAPRLGAALFPAELVAAFLGKP